MSHNKGGPGGGSSKDEKWDDFYQFNGAKIEKLPLPPSLPLDFGRELDALAQAVAAQDAVRRVRFRDAKSCARWTRQEPSKFISTVA